MEKGGQHHSSMASVRGPDSASDEGTRGGSVADKLFFSSDLEAKHAVSLKGEAQVKNNVSTHAFECNHRQAS